MAKTKTRFVCSSCGKEHIKWYGRCQGCGEWNTLEETIAAEVKSGGGESRSFGEFELSTLSEITISDEVRFKTGLSELDRVLGGGLVKGSLVLLGGDPGIGKSTLMLQICQYLGGGCSVLYVSGEESRLQIKLRAERLGVDTENLKLAAATDCELICEAARKTMPDVLVIDSIQTMQIGSIASSPGSVVQVRECTGMFMRLAKGHGISVFIIGHVNKDGGIAGPKILEHIVDTVLYFEGDKQLSYRILRAVKNRFGSTNEIGVFKMENRGLSQVQNPSAMLLSGRPRNVSGSSVACAMEGSRPILAEVQALVAKSGFGTPRRVAEGFDYNRLHMLLAVLEKRTGNSFSAFDVYINVVGGLSLDEPAADLAIVMSLYSGLLDKPIDEGTVVFGEVGLGGEVRSVSCIHERITEAARLGFTRCIVPKLALKSLEKGVDYGIKILGVANLAQSFKVLELPLD